MAVRGGADAVSGRVCESRGVRSWPMVAGRREESVIGAIIDGFFLLFLLTQPEGLEGRFVRHQKVDFC